MTEASVSFAGTPPTSPSCGTPREDRPGQVPGGRQRPAGAGGVVLHRDRLGDQAEHVAESLS
jgi:hypothetical protein